MEKYKGYREMRRARKMKITEGLVKKCGVSVGCPGCSKIEKSQKGSRAHNEVCRRRIREEMEKTEDGRQRFKKMTTG